MKINARDRLAIFVVREEEGASWTSAQHAINVTWHLFMMHWDETKGLLYINSSAKGPFDRLAAAICGEGVRRIQGESVFRCLHGFKRLIIRNLGLTHHQGRGVRFSMYMGVDVAEGLHSAKSQARIKNNAFGAGYVDGVPVSRGCSAKGKFWALSPINDLNDWVDWCREIGGMVTDAGISTDDVFASAMKPRLISSRPPVNPVAINWPEGLLTQVEERIEISFAGRAVSFAECDIELASNDADGPLRFAVISDRDRAEFEIVFQDGAAIYPQRAGPRAIIKIAGKERLLSDYFGDDSPHIDFGDGSLLIYSHLYALPEDRVVSPFGKNKIEVWDWSGVDIRKESQGPTKDEESIQRRVIHRLISADEPYDIIFDDDGPGEIADVVAIRMTVSLVSVTFFHCKYSSGHTPGSRVKDLYEVCGQAQKSARWRDRPNRMIKHMLRREKLRLERGQDTRFEQGSAALLKKLNAMWQEYRYEYQVRIVQPGLSKERIELEPLHLLAGAETYLLETRAMPVLVIASR